MFIDYLKEIWNNNSFYEQSWDRVGVLYRLYGKLYAVSAINRMSFIVLWRIGGHWQVKSVNTILRHKNTIISENRAS